MLKIAWHMKVMVLAACGAGFATRYVRAQPAAPPRATLATPFDRVLFTPDSVTMVGARSFGDRGWPPANDQCTQLVAWDAASFKEKISIRVPLIDVDSLVISPDSRRVAALTRGISSGPWPPRIRMWNLDDGTEHLVPQQVEVIDELPRFTTRCALFFSRGGELMALCRVMGQFMDYEIWHTTRQKRFSKGALPIWCRGYPGEPFTVARAALATDRLAEEIDHNWEAVLWQCYPAVFWGGSFTGEDPLSISRDAKTLFRIPKPSKTTLEVWTLADEQCRTLRMPRTIWPELRHRPRTDAWSPWEALARRRPRRRRRMSAWH
jgi:hypothetical protein